MPSKKAIEPETEVEKVETPCPSGFENDKAIRTVPHEVRKTYQNEFLNYKSLTNCPPKKITQSQQVVSVKEHTAAVSVADPVNATKSTQIVPGTKDSSYADRCFASKWFYDPLSKFCWANCFTDAWIQGGPNGEWVCVDEAELTGAELQGMKGMHFIAKPSKQLSYQARLTVLSF
jgi:hypothetical protein